MTSLFGEKEAVEALLEGIIPEQINHLHKIINQIRMRMDHYSRGKQVLQGRAICDTICCGG